MAVGAPNKAMNWLAVAWPNKLSLGPALLARSRGPTHPSRRDPTLKFDLFNAISVCVHDEVIAGLGESSVRFRVQDFRVPTV